MTDARAVSPGASQEVGHLLLERAGSLTAAGSGSPVSGRQAPPNRLMLPVFDRMPPGLRAT